MTPLRAAIAVLALLTAGCTTLGPDYQRPALKLPPAWRVELRDAAELANTEWWRGLGDAQLDAHIEAALAANQDLMLATLRVEQYEARLQGSQAANYPTLGYTASGQRERRSQERPNGLRPGASASLSNYEVAGNLTWELDLWGRVKRANEAARAELLGAQDSRRGVMLTLASEVASAYLRLVEADARLALAREMLDNRTRMLALVQRRADGGQATLIEVVRARGDIETEAARIPPLEREIAELESALAILMGRPVGRIERGPIARLALLQLPQGVPADVLSRRPDVMAAEQALVAANARIGVAKAAYFPVISLNAILGVAADDLKWLSAETARSGNYGAGLAGTLFDGGRIAANVREAEVVQREMALRWQRAVTVALAEVESALAARGKAAELEAVQLRRVAAQDEVLRLTQRRFQGGQSTQLHVLDAELNLLDLKGLQIDSRGDALLALVAVYKAMGGGWMVDYDQRRAMAGATTPPEAKQ